MKLHTQKVFHHLAHKVELSSSRRQHVHHTGGHNNYAIVCFSWAQTVLVGGGLFNKGTSKLEEDSLVRVPQRLYGIGNMVCFKHQLTL